jgi:Fibronectin type III domain
VAVDGLLLAVIAAVGIVVVAAGVRASGALHPDGPARFAGGVVVGGAEAERKDEPEQAMRRFLRKRSPGGTSIPFYPRYQAALEHMDSMPRHSAGRGRTVAADAPAATLPGTWTELGPGNIGGRTRALVIAPGDGNTIYAAGVAGGVWKTTNGGTTWVALDDFMANLAVNSLAMDPNNAGVIYAGTGEGFFNGDAVQGAGIFKTTNAGADWAPVGGTDGLSAFRFVNDLVVSKGNSQHVFAATQDGVFRSLDGGATWAAVTLPAGHGGGCLDLAIRTDILPTDTVFAACGTFDPAGAVVYRNTDAGAVGGGTWTQVLGGTSPTAAELDMGRTSLAIAPSNQNFIYAISASIDELSPYNHGLHAVFRSTTGGGAGTWTAQVRNDSPTKLNTLLLSNPREATRSNCGQGSDRFFNQGWYDNAIAVDPSNENIVYAGGVDLFRSNDGGLNWGHMSRWDRAPVVHADQHAIAFHPGYNGAANQTMFVGNDGGIYKTTNALATVSNNICSPWTNGGLGISVGWTTLNNGYGVTQFYDGTAFPNGTSYFGGTQDNGTIRSSDAAGAGAWFEEIGGDGGYVAVNPSNTNIMYGESQGFFFQRSTDGGASWFLKNTLPRLNNCAQECMPFITPFAIDPTTPTRLYTGGWYAYRTDNQADTWVQVGPITLGNAAVSAIGNSPANANLLLVGMEDGRIHRLTNATTANSGTPWATVTTPIDGAWVSSFGFHPTDPDIAYATFSTFGAEHVWKTDDAGQTWVAIDGAGDTAFPDIPAHSIVVDPVNPTTLYVGTDLGVLVSTDDGATWAVENAGFANVITEKLQIVGTGATRKLFAFTHGRGAWRTPVVASTTVPGTPTGVTATAGNAQADVSWAAPATDGGSAVTNYIVTPYAGATAGTPKEVGNVLSTTVTGLTNGTAYTFKVKAKNAVGEGPESPPSNEVTPQPPPPPNTTIDSGPTGTTVTSSYAFTFSSAPAGATFECRRNGGPWGACTSPHTLSLLVPGVETFEVRAVGAGGPDLTPAARSLRLLRPFVYDHMGEGLADVAAFRPSIGRWFFRGQPYINFGQQGDVPLPGQWDSDVAGDLALYRPSIGRYYFHGLPYVNFGAAEDVPVPADYNGDGKLDIANFRPSIGRWFFRGLPFANFGQAGDIPLPGQWDTDPEADLALFRPSLNRWFFQGAPLADFGAAGDVPVPADYNGDGKLDIAVFRPSLGRWFFRGLPSINFGQAGDIPVPGQWDADLQADLAIFRPSIGRFYFHGAPYVNFGQQGDIP